ncbi:helix-turn-helix domain-containing protein [Kitasatospora sp. NPDC052896]|uniref:helix-turn-helix domain-containing protein n=1 Tax=Kitasatospora sp. NPDC052896 TaxID=3364061 RepID=UPI0037C6C38D
MARKPRPIDPTEGPLQAFAYDLRVVREEAGNPTYRALAERAGFGATTLSDAAGGTRQPSLEVTLAYVGACGGDVALWEERWQRLDRELTAERAAAQSAKAAESIPGPATRPPVTPAASSQLPAAGPATPSEVSAVEEISGPAGGPAEHGPGSVLLGRWLRSRWSVVGVAAVLAGLITALVLWLPQKSGGSHPAAAASPCPAAPSGVAEQAATAFTGFTYQPNTRIHTGAVLSSPVSENVPSGCELRFIGYCLGDTVVDTTSGMPDMRWFELSGGGVVSSAVVHNNPPVGLPPTQCADDVPMPAQLTLTAAPQNGAPGTLTLHASGPNVGIVGYAGYYASGTGSTPGPAWHQLGFSADASNGFPATLQTGSLPQQPSGGYVLVGVACLGGSAPTQVADARQLSPGGTAAPVTLSADQLTDAEQKACQYLHLG